MNKPLLLTLAAAALVAAGLAGMARQTAPPTSTMPTAPATTEKTAADAIPFAHLIGEHCTAWVTAPGGGDGRSMYAQRAGGIWTVDNRLIAVSGKLAAIEGGWAHFRAGRAEETWVPLTAIIALQRDTHIRPGPNGFAVFQGPGIHVLPRQTGQERP